ncbi:unnamed protein product [Nezara viridula]|uniref:Neuropeptide n=1 Tax=Nezara viridula TaxID=85310 RepID=A0A9P0HS08_NEZVI|nr:unnamed protein product [Nezara viridula]
MDCRSVVFVGLLGLVGGSPVWHRGYGYDVLKSRGYHIYPESFHLAEAVFDPEYDKEDSPRKAFELEHDILKSKIGANHPELIPHLQRDEHFPPHDVFYEPKIYSTGIFTKKNSGQYGYHLHGTYHNEIDYLPYR